MNTEITKIEIDLSNWEEHYPTGCILYHYEEVIDSEYCDDEDEFIEFIKRYKDNLVQMGTEVKVIFDGFCLDNGSAMKCARKVWEYAHDLIYNGGREVMKYTDIPADVLNEIDFMLGSIEECNSEYLLPILLEHGIDPAGRWLYMDKVPINVIYDIYKRLFLSGILHPFYTEWEDE